MRFMRLTPLLRKLQVLKKKSLEKVDGFVKNSLEKVARIFAPLLIRNLSA